MCGWAWSWAQSSAKTPFSELLGQGLGKILQSGRTFYLAAFPPLSPSAPYLSQFEPFISPSTLAWHMPVLPARHIRYLL